MKYKRISKEIKETAKEIHSAEHKFVGDKIKKSHKLEDYYYLLGSIVLDKIDKSNIEIFNKVVDLEDKFEKIIKQMKEVSKQQKYLWQSLEDKEDLQ